MATLRVGDETPCQGVPSYLISVRVLPALVSQLEASRIEGVNRHCIILC